mmetsp:Transcript_105133/g.336435  ORF Transcript_105133/g.336435 Transcript_105133/m.336435 type:complete len:830 (+) Transcript_105133:130-2619(+)
MSDIEQNLMNQHEQEVLLVNPTLSADTREVLAGSATYRRLAKVGLVLGAGACIAAVASIGTLGGPRGVPAGVSAPSKTDFIEEGMLPFFKGLLAKRAAAPPPVPNAIKKLYSEDSVRAFAALAKISFCGPLPGIYAAVAETCTDNEGVVSDCTGAQFKVTPGFVRTIDDSDLGIPDSIFGILAKVEPTSETSAIKSGAIIAIRGSVDNNGNSIRDKETTLNDGLEGCEGCKVHQGYHESYNKFEASLQMQLEGIGCQPGECTIYVTGHGSGASVASLVAWELSEVGYTIGTSYVFAPPKMGDGTFSKKMNKKFATGGDHGVIFSVSHGKDSLVRWPFDANFQSWGIQAYYADDSATKATQICYSGSSDCSVWQYTQAELSSVDTCDCPVAPDHGFCTFLGWEAQCYGGWSHNTVSAFKRMYPEMWNESAGVQQPDDMAAANWYPAEGDGEQAKALAKSNADAAAAQSGAKPTTAPVDNSAKQASSKVSAEYYNLKTLKAFAALAKLSYCGASSGVVKAIQATCNTKQGLCSDAGFGVVPNTVVSQGVDYQSQLTQPYYMAETLYFFTALIRRTNSTYAAAPYFMPSEACVLVFRGTNNLQNSDMNKDVTMVPLNDSDCQGCEASNGTLNAWIEALEAPVMAALKTSGCSPTAAQETSQNVFIAGHSMGGTMATLAMYMLQKKGFNVQLSWSMEGGRPGNMALMSYLNNQAFPQRQVPFWQTTHLNDMIPRSGESALSPNSSKLFGRGEYQVHFNNSDATKHVLCTDDDEASSRCGIYQFTRAQLDGTIPGPAQCALPFAPAGQMCMMVQTTDTQLYGLAPQCFFGGSIR